MAARADTFDLERIGLTSGEGRRFELSVAIDDLTFAAERYAAVTAQVPVLLDISRMTSAGYALRIRFTAGLTGPCMRCLRDAAPAVDVDAREVDQPGQGDELSSPYVEGGVLDLRAWARDALALALPQQIVCRVDCAGLCPLCGANLNDAPEHVHEREPDPRFAKLDELRF